MKRNTVGTVGKEPYTISLEKFSDLAKKAASSTYRSLEFYVGLSYDDLYQEATIGIMVALNRSAEKKPDNLHGYAYSFAKGYCRHLIRKNYRFRSVYNPGLEPATFDRDIIDDDLEQLLSCISDHDEPRILAGTVVSKQGQTTVKTIREKYFS